MKKLDRIQKCLNRIARHKIHIKGQENKKSKKPFKKYQTYGCELFANLINSQEAKKFFKFLVKKYGESQMKKLYDQIREKYPNSNYLISYSKNKSVLAYGAFKHRKAIYVFHIYAHQGKSNGHWKFEIYRQWTRKKSMEKVFGEMLEVIDCLTKGFKVEYPFEHHTTQDSASLKEFLDELNQES